MFLVDLLYLTSREFRCFVLLVLEVSRVASRLPVLVAAKDSRLVLVGLTRLNPIYELVVKAGKLLLGLVSIYHLT